MAKGRIMIFKELKDLQNFSKEFGELLNKYRVEINTHWDENFVLRPMFGDEKPLRVEIYADPDTRLNRIRLRIK